MLNTWAPSPTAMIHLSSIGCLGVKVEDKFLFLCTTAGLAGSKTRQNIRQWKIWKSRVWQDCSGMERAMLFFLFFFVFLKKKVFVFRFFRTLQLHPLWGWECLSSHPRQETGWASGVTAKCASFTFRGTRAIFPRPTYPAETAATLGRPSCDFSAAWKLRGLAEALAKESGKKRKKSGLPCTTPGQDPQVEFLKGLLFWIEEKSGIEGWNGCTGARGKVSIRASLVRLDTSPLGQMGIRGWSDSQESNCMVVTPR